MWRHDLVLPPSAFLFITLPCHHALDAHVVVHGGSQNELLRLVGLKQVKEQALKIYASVLAVRSFCFFFRIVVSPEVALPSAWSSAHTHMICGVFAIFHISICVVFGCYLVCIFGRRQDAKLRRIGLAKAVRPSTLNFSFVGNPGTGMYPPCPSAALNHTDRLHARSSFWIAEIDCWCGGGFLVWHVCTWDSNLIVR